MILRMLLVIVAVGCFTAGAEAQLVVGSDDTPATIYHIDVNTSVATPLLSGTDASAWGMAYDPDTNTLYWNDGTMLFSSPFSMAGLTPTNLGTVTFNGSGISLVGLAFRDGALLASRNIATEAIYEIDVNTLEATQLFVYDSGFDFGGIDVDVTTDLLFGVSDATGGGQGRGLYEIDTVGQTTTFRAPYPAGETDIDGLAANDGLAYYVVDQPGVFWIYDIATGDEVGTIPSPFTGSAIFSAAAWVSEPSTPTEKTSWGNLKGMFR